jgi:hypothetical protein
LANPCGQRIQAGDAAGALFRDLIAHCKKNKLKVIVCKFTPGAVNHMAAELRTNKNKKFRVDGNATTSFTCASRASIEQIIEANIGGRKQDEWFQGTNSISDMVESNALKIVFFDKGEMGEFLAPYPPLISHY